MACFEELKTGERRTVGVGELMPSLEAMEMQVQHVSLLRTPKRTASDKNRRFRCVCGNKVTKNQLRLHDSKCIYCGATVNT
jgi:hypothetical protein